MKQPYLQIGIVDLYRHVTCREQRIQFSSHPRRNRLVCIPKLSGTRLGRIYSRVQARQVSRGQTKVPFIAVDEAERLPPLIRLSRPRLAILSSPPAVRIRSAALVVCMESSTRRTV
jgi:hypothetical protein